MSRSLFGSVFFRRKLLSNNRLEEIRRSSPMDEGSMKLHEGHEHNYTKSRKKLINIISLVDELVPFVNKANLR
jgi:hypothetical protein